MRALAEYYKTVLVVGGEGYKCREVAELYGFQDIVVPNDIVAWDPTIAPYRVFTDEERATSRPRDFSKVNIEAIMVFSDSRDYKYADEIITSWMEQIHGEEKLPSHVYMIGDNPASDIVGGNSYGWNTCLVRTGVYQGEGNDKENPASFGVFKNVFEAVTTAIRKELGEDFKFKFDESINPIHHGNGASAIE